MSRETISLGKIGFLDRGEYMDNITYTTESYRKCVNGVLTDGVFKTICVLLG